VNRSLIPGSAFVLALAVQAAAAAQTYPSPPPPGPLPAPAPAASATVKIPAKATPAPPKDTPNTRVGISGVWEIQIQRLTGVTYTHFKIDQKDTVLTGEYLDQDGKKYPLFGSLDGKNVRVVVSLPNGTTLTFSGTQEAFTDMMGMLALSNESIPFTAAYRPKYNWLDNLSPGTGGIGQPY
jgi:hypothetical protein